MPVQHQGVLSGAKILQAWKGKIMCHVNAFCFIFAVLLVNSVGFPVADSGHASRPGVCTDVVCIYRCLVFVADLLRLLE